MTKINAGVFDKAKVKNGVIENMASLKKIDKALEPRLYKSGGVRLSFFIPPELRRKYKAILAIQGKTVQNELLQFIEKYVKENNKAI